MKADIRKHRQTVERLAGTALAMNRQLFRRTLEQVGGIVDQPRTSSKADSVNLSRQHTVHLVEKS
jgi:hypothetical protein